MLSDRESAVQSRQGTGCCAWWNAGHAGSGSGSGSGWNCGSTSMWRAQLYPKPIIPATFNLQPVSTVCGWMVKVTGAPVICCCQKVVLLVSLSSIYRRHSGSCVNADTPVNAGVSLACIAFC